MFPLSMLSGWRATVNGKPVDCGRAPEGFLSVPLAAGENVVEMACFPKGLLPGLIATAVSLLLLLAWKSHTAAAGRSPDGCAGWQDGHMWPRWPWASSWYMHCPARGRC